MSNMRSDYIRACRLHFKAGIEKHRVNVENLMRNSMGIGEHGDLMDEIEKELLDTIFTLGTTLHKEGKSTKKQLLNRKRQNIQSINKKHENFVEPSKATSTSVKEVELHLLSKISTEIEKSFDRENTLTKGLTQHKDNVKKQN